MLRKTDDMIHLLDDSLLKLQTLSVSAYIKPHMERITFWTKHLTQVRPPEFDKALKALNT